MAPGQTQVGARAGRRIRSLAVTWTLLLPAGGLSGREMELQSHHERMVLQGTGGPMEVMQLGPGEMVRLRATGPGQVGLRLCQLLGPEEALLPLDLTVVRNHAEQATVRIRMPEGRRLSIRSRSDLTCSTEVLVKIQVPPGTHAFDILASSVRRGVLAKVFWGTRIKEKGIVVTPGKDGGEVTAPETGPKQAPRPPPPPPPLVLEVPPPVLIAAVERDAFLPAAGSMHKVLEAPPAGIGPFGRLGTTVSTLLLASSMTLTLSAQGLERKAGRAAGLEEAQRLHARADRTHDAAALLGALAAGTLAGTLVLFLLE